MSDSDEKKVLVAGSGRTDAAMLLAAYMGLGEMLISGSSPHSKFPEFKLPSLTAGRSKYSRHQGKKEMERRKKKLNP